MRASRWPAIIPSIRAPQHAVAGRRVERRRARRPGTEEPGPVATDHTAPGRHAPSRAPCSDGASPAKGGGVGRRGGSPDLRHGDAGPLETARRYRVGHCLAVRCRRRSPGTVLRPNDSGQGARSRSAPAAAATRARARDRAGARPSAHRPQRRTPTPPRSPLAREHAGDAAAVAHEPHRAARLPHVGAERAGSQRAARSRAGCARPGSRATARPRRRRTAGTARVLPSGSRSPDSARRRTMEHGRRPQLGDQRLDPGRQALAGAMPREGGALDDGHREPSFRARDRRRRTRGPAAEDHHVVPISHGRATAAGSRSRHRDRRARAPGRRTGSPRRASRPAPCGSRRDRARSAPSGRRGSGSGGGRRE